MSRRKIRQERSQLFGARQVVKSFNQPAHYQHHADEAVGGGTMFVEHSEMLRIRSRYYLPGWWSDLPDAPGNSAVTNYAADIIYAVPFPSSGGGALESMSFRTGTAPSTSGSVRLGLYATTSNANSYPGALLWDSGTLSAAVADDTIVTGTCGVALDAQAIYWACFLRNAFVGGVPSLKTMTSPACENTFGIDSSAFTLAGYYTSAFSYAAYPSTFPGAATPTSGASAALPAMFLKFGT